MITKEKLFEISSLIKKIRSIPRIDEDTSYDLTEINYIENSMIITGEFPTDWVYRFDDKIFVIDDGFSESFDNPDDSSLITILESLYIIIFSPYESFYIRECFSIDNYINIDKTSNIYKVYYSKNDYYVSAKEYDIANKYIDDVILCFQQELIGRI